MITSLEGKNLESSEKVDKLSLLVDRQEQYFRINCILIYGVKENPTEDIDEVVANKIKSEMDLKISPGDIDRTYRTGVPSKGKNRAIINNFERQYTDQSVFLMDVLTIRKNTNCF